MPVKSYKGRFNGASVTVAGKELDGRRVVVVDWADDPATVIEAVNDMLKGIKFKGQFVQIDTGDDSYIFYLKK